MWSRTQTVANSLTSITFLVGAGTEGVKCSLSSVLIQKCLQYMYLGSSITVAGEVTTPPLLLMTSLPLQIILYLDRKVAAICVDQWFNADGASTQWSVCSRCAFQIMITYTQTRTAATQFIGTLNNLNQQLRVAQGSLNEATHRSAPPCGGASFDLQDLRGGADDSNEELNYQVAVPASREWSAIPPLTSSRDSFRLALRVAFISLQKINVIEILMSCHNYGSRPCTDT